MKQGRGMFSMFQSFYLTYLHVLRSQSYIVCSGMFSRCTYLGMFSLFWYVQSVLVHISRYVHVPLNRLNIPRYMHIPLKRLNIPSYMHIPLNRPQSYMYANPSCEHTNIPGSSQHTWTPFHHPPHLRLRSRIFFFFFNLFTLFPLVNAT